MNASALSSIRIATRASQLALWQANHVAGLIRASAPELTVELVHVTTAGDVDQAEALRSFGGTGVFTSEVQNAVLTGRADLGVHSLKDLPTQAAPGLTLAAIPEREETDDALVLPAGAASGGDLGQIAHGGRIGTGSVRRQAQLLRARPDLHLLEIRGNVETRLRKLDQGDYDAIVLALAGLKRLGLAARMSQRLAPPLMYAAVGQGALAIECRENEVEIRELLSRLDHPSTRARVTAERGLLAHLRAGCHAPVGAATRLDGEELILEAVVLSPDGHERLEARAQAPLARARELGVQVADLLLEQGAGKLIGG